MYCSSDAMGLKLALEVGPLLVSCRFYRLNLKVVSPSNNDNLERKPLNSKLVFHCSGFAQHVLLLHDSGLNFDWWKLPDELVVLSRDTNSLQ